MPSPFPGMDPYLEDPSVWEEFHHVFITECMYELSERLPDRYVAKIDERVQLISWSDEATRQYLPDVAVARARSGSERRPAAGSGGGAAVALAPVVIPSDEAVEVREAF